MQQVLHPIGRYGQPQEVSSLIAFLASDAAAFIAGVTIAVDGGGANVTPGTAKLWW